MKNFILITGAIIGFTHSSAHAFPTVGDNAVYSVEQMTNGNIVKAEMTSTVSKVDLPADHVTIISVVTAQAPTSQTQNISDLNNLLNLVDQCSAVGGISENVQAASLSIPTCHIHQELESDSGPVIGDMWFGRVPFGIVKSIVVQGEGTSAMTQTMLLKSFKNQK